MLASCVLYNFIRKNEGCSVIQYNQNQEDVNNSEMLSNLHQLPHQRGRSADEAEEQFVREQFKNFLNSVEGSVEWQEHTSLAI